MEKKKFLNIKLILFIIFIINNINLLILFIKNINLLILFINININII